MFSFTRSRSRLRIKNSWSRSRPKTGRLRNPGCDRLTRPMGRENAWGTSNWNDLLSQLFFVWTMTSWKKPKSGDQQIGGRRKNFDMCRSTTYRENIWATQYIYSTHTHLTYHTYIHTDWRRLSLGLRLGLMMGLRLGLRLGPTEADWN